MVTITGYAETVPAVTVLSVLAGNPIKTLKANAFKNKKLFYDNSNLGFIKGSGAKIKKTRFYPSE